MQPWCHQNNITILILLSRINSINSIIIVLVHSFAFCPFIFLRTIIVTTTDIRLRRYDDTKHSRGVSRLVAIEYLPLSEVTNHPVFKPVTCDLNPVTKRPLPL